MHNFSFLLKFPGNITYLINSLIMQEYFEASGSSLLSIILSALGVYVIIIILTRIAGKRSFSKMSNFDFAMTISIGAMIATTILSPSVTFLQGLVGLISIFLLSAVSNYLRQFPLFRKAIDNTPLLLMDGPEILHQNLKKVRLSEEDLLANLRRANIIQLAQVKAVVFESTGEISVLHSENSSAKLEEFLITNVSK